MRNESGRNRVIIKASGRNVAQWRKGASENEGVGLQARTRSKDKIVMSQEPISRSHI